MTEFKFYNETTAPEKSRALLADIKKNYGFIPNVLGAMAQSPAALEGYRLLSSALTEKGQFSPLENNLIQLVISEENDCGFCVPAHSFILKNVIKADAKVIEAARKGEKIPDAKLDTLVLFTRRLVQKRGNPVEADLQAFMKAGYTQGHLFELIALAALKTMTNWSHHISKAPLNKEFQSEVWSKKDMRSAA